MELTHFNEQGRAKMVNVGDKFETKRKAIAKATVKMKPVTLNRIMEGKMKKGDVLQVAQVAGIMGAKKTSDLIPMCHPLFLSGVDIEFKINVKSSEIDIFVIVETTGKTGVEMEALTAASITALTIYDMCKAIDKDMEIKQVCLIEKMGGKSGHYIKEEI